MMTRLLLTLIFCLWALPAQAVLVVVGSYTGDGTNDRTITISPQCQPKLVLVRANAASASLWGLSTSMGTSNTSQLTGTANGDTTRIQALVATGFEIDSGVNTNLVVYRYAAFCDNGANDFAEGTYVGAPGDARDIPITPEFAPEWVLVMNGGAAVTYWRGATSHSGDLASPFTAAAAAANFIEGFTANGFTVGTGLNSNGVNFYYVALKASASVQTGNFLGDTDTARNIATTGQTPEFVGVKGSSATAAISYRFSSNVGDESYTGTVAPAANIIQLFDTDLFQVGSASGANENGVTMRWFALADFTVDATPTRRRAF